MTTISRLSVLLLAAALVVSCGEAGDQAAGDDDVASVDEAVVLAAAAEMTLSSDSFVVDVETTLGGEVVEASQVIYNAPGNIHVIGSDADLETVAVDGQVWIRGLSDSDLFSLVTNGLESSPTDEFLEVLRAASEVKDVERDDNGYRFMASLGSREMAVTATLSDGRIDTLTVEVDAGGRPGESTMAFGDFDAATSVTAPAADQLGEPVEIPDCDDVGAGSGMTLCNP